jgi:hypothetical protein
MPRHDEFLCYALAAMDAIVQSGRFSVDRAEICSLLSARGMRQEAQCDAGAGAADGSSASDKD